MSDKKNRVFKGDSDAPGFFTVVCGDGGRPYILAEGNLPAISDRRRLRRLANTILEALEATR